MNNWYLAKFLADQHLAEVAARAERHRRLLRPDSDAVLEPPRPARNRGWWARHLRPARA